MKGLNSFFLPISKTVFMVVFFSSSLVLSGCFDTKSSDGSESGTTGACCIPRRGVGPASICVDRISLENCTALGGAFTENAQCSSLTTCKHQLTGVGACSELFAKDNTNQNNGFGNWFRGGCRDSASPDGCNGIFYDGRQCSDLQWNESPVSSYLGSPGACFAPHAWRQSGDSLVPVSCVDGSYRYECEFAEGVFYPLVTCDASSPPAVGACSYDGICESFMTESDCDSRGGSWTVSALCSDTGWCCPGADISDWLSSFGGFISDSFSCESTGGSFTPGAISSTCF